jgi:hypothetical protein
MNHKIDDATKPPIGVKHEKFFLEEQNKQRIADLESAISRYERSGFLPLQSWIEELMRRRKGL